MKQIILILIIFFLSCSPGWAKSSAKKAVKKGNLLYNKGEFSQALKNYQEALLAAPESDIVNYDLGAALYKTDDYQGAIGHFEKGLVSEDSFLEQMASYNIANAKYKHGIGLEDSDLNQAIGFLRESLRHYEHALEIDPRDQDAKYNYEFVKQELERLLKKEQQQKQKQQQGGSQGEEEQQKQQAQNQQQEQEQEQQQQKQEQQEQKQQQQEQKQQQQPQQQQQQASAQPDQDQMSEQEARMLLEGYAQEDEPKGLYREKMPKVSLPDVTKDW